MTTNTLAKLVDTSPIKPCKGCWHFDETILGQYCMYQGTWVSYIDPLSGQRLHKRQGEVTAKQMRSDSGLCQRDRKLYETFWQILWKLLRRGK